MLSCGDVPTLPGFLLFRFFSFSFAPIPHHSPGNQQPRLRTEFSIAAEDSIVASCVSLSMRACRASTDSVGPESPPKKHDASLWLRDPGQGHGDGVGSIAVKSVYVIHFVTAAGTTAPLHAAQLAEATQGHQQAHASRIDGSKRSK